MPSPFAATTAEPLSHQMIRVRAEAAGIAVAHIAEFTDAVAAALAQAESVADGGEAYSVGVREVARQLAFRLEEAAHTLEVLRRREAGLPAMRF
ncbi:MAG TPA: hypothetical protein VGL58_20825 [Caulobacteraceae bacterium]